MSRSSKPLDSSQIPPPKTFKKVVTQSLLETLLNTNSKKIKTTCQCQSESFGSAV